MLFGSLPPAFRQLYFHTIIFTPPVRWLLAITIDRRWLSPPRYFHYASTLPPYAERRSFH
jgi:hypothetical protein